MNKRYITDTVRNGGLYNPKHDQKLKNLLTSSIEYYEQPILCHFRINPHRDDIHALTAYLQNRLYRKGIYFSFVKATESDDVGNNVHQHWFFTLPRFNGELDCFEELKTAIDLAQHHGIIKSYRLNPKKVVGPLGTEWVEYSSPWYPITDETLEECIQWARYAIKRRSKAYIAEIGKRAVTFSMPKPKNSSGGGAKASYGYSLPASTAKHNKRCPRFWMLVKTSSAIRMGVKL